MNDGGPIPAGLLEPAPGRGVRVVVPPRPGGRTRALNTGLAAARGTYVAYLDDDDLYLPEHLDTLVRFLDGSDEYRAAYTSVRQIEQVLGDDGRYRDGREITVYGRPFDAARLLYKNDIPLIGLAHRRALAEEIGGFDETFDQFEDWDFLIRLSARTRFHHLPSVTAVYRLRNDASNITAAQPWHSGDAQTARRRLFEKHAARRSASTEMALVDSLEQRHVRAPRRGRGVPRGSRDAPAGPRGRPRRPSPPPPPARPSFGRRGTTLRARPRSPPPASRRSPSRTSAFRPRSPVCSRPSTP